MYTRPNPMNDFMRGYGFVDSIQRANRAEQRGLERQQREDAWTDEQRGRIRQQQGDEDKRRKAASILYRMQTEGVNFQPTEDELQWAQQNMGQINPFGDALSSPEAAKEALGQIDTIFNTFQGKSGKAEGIAAFNAIYRNQLNKGDGGTDKQVYDVLPTEDGKGFYLELSMKDENGKDKRAPVTEKRSSAPDDRIKPLMAADLIQDLNRRKQLLESYLVSLGDTAPIQRQMVQSKIEADAAEGAAKREADARQKGLDREHDIKKLETEYDLKKELEKVKTKYGTASGSTPAQIQTAQWLIANGVAKNATDAWDKVTEAKFNPQQAAINIANKMAEIGSMNNDQTPYETYLKQAQQIVANMGQQDQQAPPQQPAQAQPNDNDPLGLR